MLTKKVSVSQLVFEEGEVSYLENISIFENGVFLGRIRPIRRVLTPENREFIYSEVSLGEWDSETEYVEGEVVFYDGWYYVSLQTNTNNEPTDVQFWEQLPQDSEEDLMVNTIREALSVYTQERISEVGEISAQKYSDFVPVWEPWIRARENVVYKYDEKFFRVRTPHITQPTWTPDIAVALWERVHLGDTPPEWTQPLGAHDAYPEGFLVTHNSSTWVSYVSSNVWEPGVSGWTEVEEEPGNGEEPEIQPWVQPLGSEDAYGADAVVIHNGQTWINTHGDGNVWEPGVYGWEVVE